MLECGFAEFPYRGLPLYFRAQCLPQIEGVLCLAGCFVLAQTQGYHLVRIWGSLVKYQGSGVVVKFDVFLHCYAVCLCCFMQAMTHSADNVPSQQAVKLVVVGLGFVEQCWLRLFLGDQLQ